MTARRIVLLVAGALMVTIVVTVWIVYRRSTSREGQIAYHRHAMWTAWERASPSSGSAGRFQFAVWLRQILTLRTGTSYYIDQAREHERALHELGYFTNIDLSLGTTNISREFRSNFVARIQQRFGTNEQHAWILYPMPDKTGYRPALPASDIAEWSRIFRECVERYASNAPARTVPAP